MESGVYGGNTDLRRARVDALDPRARARQERRRAPRQRSPDRKQRHRRHDAGADRLPQGRDHIADRRALAAGSQSRLLRAAGRQGRVCKGRAVGSHGEPRLPPWMAARDLSRVRSSSSAVSCSSRSALTSGGARASTSARQPREAACEARLDARRSGRLRRARGVPVAARSRRPSPRSQFPGG